MGSVFIFMAITAAVVLFTAPEEDTKFEDIEKETHDT